MSRSRRFALVTGLSAVALAGLLFAGVSTGSVKIPLPELLGILFAEGGEGTAREVVWLIRLPRLAMAALLG
ncbi:MAG: iron ABC transporter permease, partial [Clostridia bacterium]|nr:iron ABC transporter permease [Clostridia bacterium]